MRTYFITLDGLPLCYYGERVYGWGQRPSIDRGQLGRVVEFTMRQEAQDWLQRSGQFGRGAVVQERGKRSRSAT